MSTGRVLQVNVSPGGVPKLPVASATVGAFGLLGDGHEHPTEHGGPHRAVCILGIEVIRGSRRRAIRWSRGRSARTSRPRGCSGRSCPSAHGPEWASGCWKWPAPRCPAPPSAPTSPTDASTDLDRPASIRLAHVRARADRGRRQAAMPSSRCRRRRTPRRTPIDYWTGSTPASRSRACGCGRRRGQPEGTSWILDDGELSVAASPELPGPAFNNACGLRRLPHQVPIVLEHYRRSGVTGWLPTELEPWPDAEPDFELAVTRALPGDVADDGPPKGRHPPPGRRGVAHLGGGHGRRQGERG